MDITIEHSFEYAHRLPFHTGKCRNLHGHSACVILTLHFDQDPALTSNRLTTNNGMLIDFGDLKYWVADLIDTNFDHALFLSRDDPWWGHLAVLDTKLVVFPSNMTTTSEYICRVLYNMLHKIIASELNNILNVDAPLAIEFFEGPNSSTTISDINEIDKLHDVVEFHSGTA